MIIKIEQANDGRWTVEYGCRWRLGGGATRTAAIISARKAYPVAMACVPLQAEEIPAELREIGRRMRAVGSSVPACAVSAPYAPTADAMLSWAGSVEAWGDDLAKMAEP